MQIYAYLYIYCTTNAQNCNFNTFSAYICTHLHNLHTFMHTCILIHEDTTQIRHFIHKKHTRNTTGSIFLNTRVHFLSIGNIVS